MGVIWASMANMTPYDQVKYPLCTAERHTGKGIRSDYVIAIVAPDLEELGYESDELVYGICRDCLAHMAADLGTTPEEGEGKPL